MDTEVATREARHRAPRALLVAAVAASVAAATASSGVAWLAAAPAVALATLRRWRVGALGTLLGLALGTRGAAPALPAIDARALPVPTAQVLEGTVLSADPPGPRGTTAVLDVASVAAPGDAVAPGGDALLLLGPGRAPVLVPGDRVRVAALLERFPSARNPGGHDAGLRWWRLGVTLRARAPDPRSVEVVAPASGPRAAIARTRAAAAGVLQSRLDPADAGLARALVLGDRGGLDEADRTRFRASGQAHVVAVSGLHVTFLLALWLWALARLRVPPRPRDVAGIAAILLYVPFAGAAPSAVRAGLGGVLYLGTRLLGREPTGVGVLAAVALALLAADPPVFFDAGFQLSFAAVLGILLLGARLERAFVRDVPLIPGITRRPRAWVRRTFGVSLGAWLATAPFVLGHMGQLCPAGALVAVPVVPLGAALLGAGFLAALVGAVPPLGAVAATSFAGAAAVVRWYLDAVVSLGVGNRTVERPHLGWHLAYLGAFLAATLGPPRWLVRGTLAMLALLALATMPERRPPPEHPRLVLLDVGHGQCGVLSLPDGRHALLDAGSQGDPGAGERVVLPALRALGVERLALVTLSHPDADHTGALAVVARELRVARIAVSPSFGEAARQRLRALAPEVVVARRGDVLLAGSWGRLRALAPRPGTGYASDNDASLVLVLEDPTGALLVAPGDLEAAGVASLCAAAGRDGDDLRADVLVLPHHGLPGPGRERLAAAVRPRLVLASCGRADEAGLPAGTLSTAGAGALVVELVPRRPVVATPFAPRAGAAAPTAARYDPPPVTFPAVTLPSPPLLWIVPLALLAFATVATRPLRWLTPGASAAALVLGVAAWLVFHGAGLAALFAPFLVATLLGKLPGPAVHPTRAARQVAANGLPALAGVAVALAGRPDLGAGMFLGGLACLGADTCATEVGTRWGGTPRSLRTARPVEPGESGGVTLAGLLASVGGALLAPLAWAAATRFDAVLVGMVAAGGVLGALADSWLGATVQYRGRDPGTGKTVESVRVGGVRTERVSGRAWLDNDGVNLAAGLVAALATAALLGLRSG